MGSYEPETEPWIGIKNQQKPKSEEKAPLSWNFLVRTTSCHYTTPVQTLLYFFYVIIKQGAQDMQRKRRTVLKLLGKI
jgi:hypothetical protein